MLFIRLEFLDVSEPNKPAPEPEYGMDVPPTDAYRDLHGGMVDALPPINSNRIHEYMHQFDKSVDRKSVDMYNERFESLYCKSSWLKM